VIQVFIRVVVSAALAVAVVACGGGASPSVNDGPVGSAPGPAASTAAGTPASSEGAGAPSVTSVPSLTPITTQHADPALEALLPAEVDGIAMQRSSYKLSEMLDAGGDRATIDAFLTSIGKSEADGSSATAADPTNKMGGGILALKVNGADPAVLLPAIVSLEKADLGAGATTREATVGGKNVTVVSIGSGVNDTEWIYGRGDVVFVVHASDEALATKFLQALS
jgi:hypothetical protein